MNHKKYIALYIIIFMNYSCTNISLAPDVVTRDDAQKQQYVVIGVIEDINTVTIEGDREAGAIAGGLIGGVAGKNVTDSEPESDIATVIGGLVGSAVGSELGSALTQKEGVELLIRTEAGRLVSIIQEVSQYNFILNQKVRIVKRNGKSRVIPFN
tara:strand:- start:217 stop:681 length:465 start_codon:yes stop_codon:yes gene_type:complete